MSGRDTDIEADTSARRQRVERDSGESGDGAPAVRSDEAPVRAAEDPSESADLTRRGLFALAGVAGLGFLGAGNASAAHNGDGSGFSDLDTIHVVGSGPNQYPTIQAAHDALPAGGGQILVSDSYDNGDDFPVVLSKRGLVRGTGGGTTVSAGDATAFRIESEANRPPTIGMRDLRINGGYHGVNIVDSRFTRFYNVHVNGASGCGFRTTNTSSNPDPTTHRFVGCEAELVGEQGWYLDDVSNAVELISCQAIETGREGVYARNSYNLKVLGGTYELCAGPAFTLRGSNNFTIRDAYIEGNDHRKRGGNGKREIFLIKTQTGTITSCYFNGYAKQYGITFAYTGTGVPEHVSVRDCGFRNYSRGFVQLVGGENNDFHRPSHRSYDGSPFIWGDGGEKNRSDGVIGAHTGRGTDLTAVAGDFYGDRGLHDGSAGATANRPGPAWYDGEAWYSLLDGSRIE